MSASPGAGARSPLTPSKRQTSPPADGRRRKRFSPAKLLRRLSSSKSCGDDADLDGSARARLSACARSESDLDGSARARLTMPFTHARRALSLGGRWTAVDGTVIVGTKPSALLGDPRRLAAMGVTGVVNLCAEFRGPVAAYRRLAIEHLRLPTSDHVEPAAEVLDAAVAFIRKHERAGGRVYVHCKAGHGRSAAVAYAWLVFADRGATSPRAVYAAFARKRTVRRGLWRQPNVASMAEQLALSDYKTPAARRATRS